MMLKVRLIHPPTNVFGGAERLLIAMVECLMRLRNSDIEVIIGANKIRLTRREKFQYIISRLTMSRLGEYLPVTLRHMYNLMMYGRCCQSNCIVIDTGCLYAPFTSCDIGYVHFPMFYQHLLLKGGLHKFYGTLLKNISVVLYTISNTKRPSFLLFNSNYTYKMTNKIIEIYGNKYIRDFFYNAKHVILHPPFITKINTLDKYNGKRINQVVTIGRIEPFKKLEKVIEVANIVINQAQVNDITFLIIGFLQDKNYYKKLQRLIKAYNLEGKVIIKINISDEEKIRLLLSSKVLFHPVEHDHFGISIIEGLLFGLIPVVYDSGGPAEIVRSNKVGYLYKDIEEAARKIIKSIYQWNDDVACILRDKANSYSNVVFCKKFLKIIEDLVIWEDM